MIIDNENEITKTWIKPKNSSFYKKTPSAKLLSTILIIGIISFFLGYYFAVLAKSSQHKDIVSNLYNQIDQLNDEIKQLTAILNKNKTKQSKHEIADDLFRHDAMHSEQNKAIFSVFSNAIDLIKLDRIKDACSLLRSISYLNEYDGQWKSKATYLLKKYCKESLITERQ